MSSSYRFLGVFGAGFAAHAISTSEVFKRIELTTKVQIAGAFSAGFLSGSIGVYYMLFQNIYALKVIAENAEGLKERKERKKWKEWKEWKERKIKGSALAEIAAGNTTPALAARQKQSLYTKVIVLSFIVHCSLFTALLK